MRRARTKTRMRQRRKNKVIALDDATFVHHLVTQIVRDLKPVHKKLEIALDERHRELWEEELKDPIFRKIVEDRMLPVLEKAEKLVEGLRRREMKDITPPDDHR